MTGVLAREPERRLARRWLLGYTAALFVALPLALPCWNAFLRDTLGRVVTIEQIHVLQYLGLGWLIGWYSGTTGSRRWLTCWGLPLLMAVGVADELLQGCLPQRVFQASDIAFNMAGGLAGLGLMNLTRRGRG